MNIFSSNLVRSLSTDLLEIKNMFDFNLLWKLSVLCRIQYRWCRSFLSDSSPLLPSASPPSSPPVSLSAPEGWRGCSGSLCLDREEASWAPSASSSPCLPPVSAGHWSCLTPCVSLQQLLFLPHQLKTWMGSGCRPSSRRSWTHPVSVSLWLFLWLCSWVSVFWFWFYLFWA